MPPLSFHCVGGCWNFGTSAFAAIRSNNLAIISHLGRKEEYIEERWRKERKMGH
jgi:hypothetical protein